jgi:hypothetical protein
MLITNTVSLMCGKLLSNLQVTALNSHIKLLLKQLPSQSRSARKPHLILKAIQRRYVFTPLLVVSQFTKHCQRKFH